MSDALFFEPWVGSKFGTGWEEPEGYAGTPVLRSRLLILGEAHYGNAVEYEQGFTQQLIRNFAIPRRRGTASLTKALKAVRCGEGSRYDSQWEWDRVAFANFVQRFVGDRARTPPDEADWGRGRAAFPALLDRVQPDFILALGRRLWRELPRNVGVPLRFTMDQYDDVELDDGWVYPLGGGRVAIASYISHPAGRFDARKALLRSTLLHLQANADLAHYPELVALED